MLLHEIIHLHKNSFTQTEEKIANYLEDNIEDIHRYQLVSLSDRVGVSKSAMLRFCQKLGYSGFSEFKYEVSRQLLAGSYEQETEDQSAETYINYYLSTIGKILDETSDTSIKSAYTLIKNADKIRIFGIHESGLSAKYLSYRLSKIGYDSEPVLNSNEFFEKANFSSKGQLNIFISLGASSLEIVEAHDVSLNKNCDTLLFTSNLLADIAKTATSIIYVPTFDTDPKKIFLDSQPVLMTLIDFLVSRMALFDQKNKKHD
ncbi:MurR/RpiR family transcriptional regulator [Erysipelothrix urinaevulpis]|uniref:MurR/RpiR family transcriptional regulator n=1 Tax=Erysipelothrix urinaevulpis TaxID=2683717 RepID=UPI00135CC263|nr:MurR/RpiR family transcriptional regulator [Erysipelothrix urinaevulpis]